MQMYPQYKLRDVLDEYAIVFFRLLNEGYKLKYRRMLELAQIEMMAYMEKKDRGDYIHSLELAASDLGDILKPSVSDSEAEEAKLKKLFGQ